MEAKMEELFAKISQLEAKDSESNASGSKRSTASWKKSGDKKQGGKKPGIPKSNVGQKVVNPNPPGKVPQGQYLSKTSTELSNDPLSEKAYFPGPSSAFMAIASKEKIYSGATLLPQLQRETYEQICAVNPSFAKSVPKCASDYYFAVLTMVRLLRLHMAEGGRTTPDEAIFLTQINEFGFTVPKSVALFISGFGRTKIPSGREVHFAMAKPTFVSGTVVSGEREYEIPGFFGPIIENLGTYSSYPCLGVYAQRILQDLVHPANQVDPVAWNLPEDLRTDKPLNRNCLGYEESMRLSPEQRSFMSGVGMTVENFEFDSEVLPIHYDLLTAVHLKLSASRMTLHPLLDSRAGSVGQLPVETISSQSTSSAVKAKYIASTSFDLPASEGFLGSSFLYNVRKTYEELRITKSIMPITYRVNDPVPLEARERLDLLFMGTTSLVKQQGFETIPFSPGLRIGEIVKVDFNQ